LSIPENYINNNLKMQQKYAYAYNGLYNWIRGIIWVPPTKA
jgi:hypothetical protein